MAGKKEPDPSEKFSVKAAFKASSRLNPSSRLRLSSTSLKKLITSKNFKKLILRIETDNRHGVMLWNTYRGSSTVMVRRTCWSFGNFLLYNLIHSDKSTSSASRQKLLDTSWARCRTLTSINVDWSTFCRGWITNAFNWSSPRYASKR